VYAAGHAHRACYLRGAVYVLSCATFEYMCDAQRCSYPQAMHTCRKAAPLQPAGTTTQFVLINCSDCADTSDRGVTCAAASGPCSSSSACGTPAPASDTVTAQAGAALGCKQECSAVADHGLC
jgi:hypothetical protein